MKPPECVFEIKLIKLSAKVFLLEEEKSSE
jgi:hypothetical protein